MSSTLDFPMQIMGAEQPIWLRQAAKAAISRDGAYLLIMEYHSDGTPFWTLPGGGIREDESLKEGLRREIREEIDCQVVIGDPTETVWYAHTTRERTVSAYNVFECSISSEPKPNAEEDIVDYRWIRPDEFPTRTIPQIRYLFGR